MGGPGVAVYLNTVTVGTGAASGVCTVYKGVGAGGTVIGTLDAVTASNFMEFETSVLGGVYVTVTGGAAKCTVTYDC